MFAFRLIGKHFIKGKHTSRAYGLAKERTLINSDAMYVKMVSCVKQIILTMGQKGKICLILIILD